MHTEMQNNNLTTNVTIPSDGKWNIEEWKFLATFGGAGVSLFCFLLLICILCLLVNVKKRLKRLERWYTKNNREHRDTLTAQTSLQSQPSVRSDLPNYSDNLPNVDQIPKVPRRSEYIRTIRNVAGNFLDRVSKTFILDSSNPRSTCSSSDTFDLSKPEEPIYDDIPQYRNSEQPEGEKFLCCCCCKIRITYEKARTSDLQSTNVKTTKREEPKRQVSEDPNIENEIEEIKDPPKKYGIYSKKKEKMVQETDSPIDVQHVDFDERGKYIQPSDTDDVTIGLQQKPIKQINKEQQLVSFGKNSAASPKLQEKPMTEPKPQNATTSVTNAKKLSTFSGRVKKIQGIKLPFPMNMKHIPKSLPRVNEEVNGETSEETEKEERDPSYIEMKDTLKVPPLPEKRGKQE